MKNLIFIWHLLVLIATIGCLVFAIIDLNFLGITGWLSALAYFLGIRTKEGF